MAATASEIAGDCAADWSRLRIARAGGAMTPAHGGTARGRLRVPAVIIDSRCFGIGPGTERDMVLQPAPLGPPTWTWRRRACARVVHMPRLMSDNGASYVRRRPRRLACGEGYDPRSRRAEPPLDPEQDRVLGPDPEEPDPAGKLLPARLVRSRRRSLLRPYNHRRYHERRKRRAAIRRLGKRLRTWPQAFGSLVYAARYPSRT